MQKMSSVYILSMFVAIASANSIGITTPKPQDCGSNAFWSPYCAHFCEDTCKTYFSPIKIYCIGICKPGCSCNKGYILKDRTHHECILPSECKEAHTSKL